MPATMSKTGRPPDGQLQLFAMRDVPIFKVGSHHPGEPEWTAAELRTIATNFNNLCTGDHPLLEVPVVVGHGDGFTEQPACGFVVALKYDAGTESLVADISHVDAATAAAVRRRRLYSVS